MPDPSPERARLESFHEPVRDWFRASFAEPTSAQLLGWAPILEGKSTLLLAPTGSGKTLAAFLTSLDRLMFTEAPPEPERCRLLYVSPLKALAVDVERNLRAPLAGIAAAAEQSGVKLHLPEIGIRTGDTSARERARMLRHPPDVMITTPESLFLLLTSRARETLRSVETVIVDEIHSLVATKRGAHLFLSLERLESLRSRERIDSKRSKRLQRIGLSATQRPLEEVARLLGGGEMRGGIWTPREVAIVDAGAKKQIELTVEVPVDDMSRLGELVQNDADSQARKKKGRSRATAPSAAQLTKADPRKSRMPGERNSIWPALHPRLLELVRAHRSTMIFVNSRSVGEKLATALNELAGEEIALAHHGSVAREERQIMEERLKAGTLPCIVATSSLELGIDMGAVDLVIQIEAPPSVASGLQRLGRARHQVGGVPHGVLFPKHRGDLLASAAAAAGMAEGAVEATFYPKNPLDVLAQQIVAIATESSISREEAEPPESTDPRDTMHTNDSAASETAEANLLRVDELYDLVRSAAPFAELPKSAFEGVLDMLSGRYPSDEFAELRPRITWDRVQNTLKAREGSQRVAIANAGTIPDRGFYGVFLAGDDEGKSRRVGELDEEMVFEMRQGEVFILGASSWRIEEITRDRVLVSPAPGVPGRMPFWHGDRAGRSFEFGERIGKLARELSQGSDESGRARLKTSGLDERAASNLLAYLRDQIAITGEVPSDRQIVVERFFDELGDVRVCVMTPFGARVHAPWATAVQARLNRERGLETDALWSDDGMVFRLSEADSPPESSIFFPAPEEIEQLVTQALGDTALFAARFRENAGRALLLPRKKPGQRSPLWATRRRAAELLVVAKRYGSFPILLETYRECLRDAFDLPSLISLLNDVQQRKIKVSTVDTQKASPFAASLLFAYVASFIYDGDAPLAERRAQALSLDHAQLRELLGDGELRELLDAGAIADFEMQAQKIDRSDSPRPLRSPDGVHDLLLALGDLSLEEISARMPETERAQLPAWIESLAHDKRVLRVSIAGSSRLIAAEDIARFRDALGVVPPPGIAPALLEPVAHPLLDLASRFARTHGPFFAEELAARFGLGIAPVRDVLLQLVASDRVLEGGFLPPTLLADRAQTAAPGASEFCDAEVLRVLKQRSLSRLRHQVEAVPQAALCRFLLEWQGALSPSRGQAALLSAIEQLQGAAIPASALYGILAARVQPLRAGDLDQLCATGVVVWRGLSSLGARDGRIALYLAEDARLLSPAPGHLEGILYDKIRALLGRVGASFFHQLQSELQAFPRDLVAALWDLVWSGEVTNDTLAPIRSLLRGEPDRDPHRPEFPSRGVAQRRAPPPGSEGRWSLVTPASASPTERAAALARSLLARHGVLTREAIHGEEIPGGFSAIYGVLKAMEEAGKIRRGYFVEGLGATQFALPGAEERLRALREPAASISENLYTTKTTDGFHANPPSTSVLAATDPANPFGASLPWPDRPGRELGHPQRAAGAQVVIRDGALLATLSRGEEHALLTFIPSSAATANAAKSASVALVDAASVALVDAASVALVDAASVALVDAASIALVDALASLVDDGVRRAVLIARIDGLPAGESPLAPAFLARGFTLGQKGLFKRRPLDSIAAESASPSSRAMPRLREPARNRMRGPLGPDRPMRPREPAKNSAPVSRENRTASGEIIGTQTIPNRAAPLADDAAALADIDDFSFEDPA